MRLDRLAPLALSSIAAAACGKGLGPDDPVPDIDYCSEAAALDACLIDSQRAGSYPAIDTIAANRATSAGAVGCAYGVALDGHILYVGTIGSIDDGTRYPACADPDDCPWGLHHMSGVASVSKSLTALGIMRLFESGRLEGDPETLTLAEVMPEVPEALADLTIHQLLGHVSGLGGVDYTPGWGDDDWLADRYSDLDRPSIHPRVMWYGIKDAVTPDPTLVDEDAGFGNYSNAAYRILGSIIDAYSLYDGGEMEEMIQDVPSQSEDVLTSGGWSGSYEASIRGWTGSPLLGFDRMRTACQHAPWREASIPFVQGFVPNPDGPGLVAGDSIDSLGRRGPSGGWLMTIGDLLRLGNGFANRQFVGEQTLERMRNYVSTDRGFDFGYGLSILPLDVTADGLPYNHPGYGHQGNLSGAGYSAMWRIVELPQGRSLGAAMMCNVDTNYTGTLGAMMDQVYTDFVALGGAPNPITLDPSAANCPAPLPAPAPPSTELEVTFGDALKQAWSAALYQSGNDLARAEAVIRAELRAHREGPAILRAWDAGDVEGAARLGLDLMWRLALAPTR